ncbi:hypothetical protein RFI_10607, partial [Reticulomyxa filosa]
LLFFFSRPLIRRRFTEESLQFGDVVIINIVEARNLAAKGQQGSNPYCFLTFGTQVKKIKIMDSLKKKKKSCEVFFMLKMLRTKCWQEEGTVVDGTARANTVNPVWNEMFGFCVDFAKGLPKTQAISIAVYHNRSDGGEDVALGSIHLKIEDIPRNEVATRFCKLEGVGSGEVLLTMQRHPLTSPNLRDILLVGFFFLFVYKYAYIIAKQLFILNNDNNNNNNNNNGRSIIIIIITTTLNQICDC